MSDPQQREAQVRIRRAPKFGVFLGLGAVVGVIVALILTAAFPIDEKVGFGATFGYFAIYGIVLGGLVGAIVAVLVDRVLARRSVALTAQVAAVDEAPEADEQPTDE